MDNTLRSAPLPTWVLDSSGTRVLASNDAATRLLGYAAGEFAAMPAGDFLPVPLPAGDGEAPPRAVLVDARSKAGETKSLECHVGSLRIDGQEAWIVTAAEPSAPHEAPLVEGLRRDLDQLAAANEALRQGAAERDQSLAWISHELRTPLASILTLCDLMLEAGEACLGQARARQVRQIRECGDHLLQLINQLLELARLESKPNAAPLPRCSAFQVAIQSLRLVEPQADRRQVRLCAPEPTDDPVILADPFRLKQVLVNLLANAVRFTPRHGWVRLRIARPAPGRVRLDIEDTGDGIPAEEFGNLFKPFVQLGQRAGEGSQGTGLGLAIVKHYVEMQQGTISVASQVGKGSVFSVELREPPPGGGSSPEPDPAPPCAAASPAADPPPATPDPAARPGRVRVMVVDDDELNRSLLGDMLSHAGFDVTTLGNGPDALRELPALDPHVVIMDVQMPGMDGLDVTRRIRALPDRRLAAVPVVGLTALGMPGDRARCLNAGMSEYLVKPFPLRQFPGLIYGLLSQRAERQAPGN